MVNILNSNCSICGNESASFEELFSHVKNDHKVTAKNYCEKYLNKKDLLTQECIPFKSWEQYITCDFIDKRNYKKWIDGLIDKHDRRMYLQGKLVQYCNLKNTKIAPSLNETFTIKCLLPIDYIEQSCGCNFNQFVSGCGLISRYNYLYSREIKIKNVTDLIIDTREQLPFKFEGINAKNEKLEYGDYAISKNTKIAIERKNSNDFISTLSGGYERFLREINRAKLDDASIVVVVESTLNDIIYKKQRFGKSSGEFIAHKMRQIMRAFDNVQFLFCDNREDAKTKSLQILGMDVEQFKAIDLQHYFKYYGNNNGQTK
jgi:hypothetical protein